MSNWQRGVDVSISTLSRDLVLLSEQIDLDIFDDSIISV